MRVLVAGRNAKVLATAAASFSNDLQIQTAATKASCFALLARTEFDLIVACETLGDGSGLEVLSHVAVNTPNTLRIFAARPSTLKLLKGELGLFGLFRTLPYPINFRKLWAALNLARSTCSDGQPAPTRIPAATPAPAASAPAASAAAAARPKHVVLEEGWTPAPRAPSASGLPHVAVVQPQADLVVQAVAKPRTPTNAPVAAVRTAGRPPQIANGQAAPAVRASAKANANRQIQAGPPDTSGVRAAARYAAAQAAKARNREATAAAPALQASSPQPEAASAPPPVAVRRSEAFKRALAKRNAGKLEANSNFGTSDTSHTSVQGGGGRRRREPGVSNDSLAQLARLATTSRSTYNSLGTYEGKRRAALFVGSGVFAAATAAVLSFFMMNANNSMAQSKLPMIASVSQPGPVKNFPWQPAGQQPTQAAPFIRSESTAGAAADLDAQAEAASENEAEPANSGPPPPPPALPPNPPGLDSLPTGPDDDQ